MKDEAKQIFDEFVKEYNRVMTSDRLGCKVPMKWHYPTQLLPELFYKSVEVTKADLGPGIYSLQKFPFYTHLKVEETLPLTRLYIDGEYWMSDDPYHVIGQHNILSNYRGNVVLVGLGLGISLYDVIYNKNVSSITIIEINNDLVELLKQYFPQTIKFVVGDFFDNLEVCYGTDRVFVDIFTNDNYHLYKPKVDIAVEQIKRHSLGLGIETKVNKWMFDFNERPVKHMRTENPQFLNIVGK
jgi:hypothetical protein